MGGIRQMHERVEQIASQARASHVVYKDKCRWNRQTERWEPTGMMKRRDTRPALRYYGAARAFDNEGDL